MTITPRFNWVFLIIAILCELLAFFRVTPGGFSLIPLGLAFGFAAFLF